MADQDVQEILLRVKSDKASITSALRDINAVKSTLSDLDGTGLNNLLKRQDESIKRFKDMREEIKRAAEESTKIDVGGGGGEPARGNALRLAGSQLRQLPSIQLGGGLSSDAIANLVRVGGALGELTEKAGLSTFQLTAAGGALGALSVALVVMTANTQKATAAAQADLDARTRTISLLSQGSKDEIQARINELATKRRINEQIKTDAEKLLATLRANNIKELGGGEALRAEITSVIGTGAGELKAARDNAEKAAKAFNETSVELDLLTQVTGLSAQTAYEAAEAEKRLQNARLYLTSDVTNKLSADIEAYNLAQTGSAKTLGDRNRQLQTEIQLTDNAIDAAKNKLETEKLDTATQKALTDTINQLILKSNALKTSFAYVNQSFVTDAIKAREAADEQNKIRQDSVSAWKKYTDDVTKLNEAEQKALADLEQKYADTKVAIAKQAATAAENALNKLTESRASLALGLARADADAQTQRQQDTLNAQIDFARDEARAARDHANDLLDIRRRAAESEEDLIAKRDFAGLFRSRRNTNNQIDDANRQYSKQRADRLEAFAQEADDRNRQFVFEQQQRIVKYNRDLADAQVQYSKELQQSRLAKNRALLEAAAAYARDQQLLYNKYQAERSARISSINSELQLIAQGNAGKLALEKQYYDQLNAFLRAQLANVGGGGSNNFSGASTPGANTINYSPSINITSGADAAQVGKIVEQKTAAYFNALVK